MDPVTYVLSFDLATKTGWAMGSPGDRAPMSGWTDLTPVEQGDTLEHNMGTLFVDLCRHRLPDLVVWETPMTPEGWFQLCKRKGVPQNGGSLIIQNILAGICRRECGRKGIAWQEVARQTVLKHFTGKASHSSAPGAGDGRERGKKAVIAQCQILGLVPITCKNDDQCDACAGWDWACSTYGRRIPAALQLFDPGTMRNG